MHRLTYPGLLSRRAVLARGGFGLVALQANKSSLANSVQTGSARTDATIEVHATEGAMDEKLRLAVSRLPKRGMSRLVFTPGRYVFTSEAGIAVLFEEMENLTIDGYGAELFFAGSNSPFVFRNCSALTVRGLTIDWLRPPFSHGKVVGISNDRRLLDLKLTKGSKLNGSEPVQALLALDEETGLVPLDHPLDRYGGIQIERVESDGQMRLFCQQPCEVPIGTTLVLRHQLFGANAFTFNYCEGELVIEDLTVHAAPGMAIYAHSCKGSFKARRVVVGIRHGADRLLSTNADAMHFDSCSGAITLEDCRFGATGDDAVNVYTAYFRIVERLDISTLVVEHWGATFPTGDLPAPGINLDLVSGQDLQHIGNAVVSRAESGRRATLHFTKRLPDSIGIGDLVVDPSVLPRLTVTNCQFVGNRGRGVVAHGNVIVERCSFRDQSRSAVFLAPDTYWLECCEVNRAVVRDNNIVGSGRSSPDWAAIQIDTLIRPPDDAGFSRTGLSGIVNAAVRVEGNRIKQPRGSAISVSATDQVELQSNEINRPGSDAIRLAQVRNVRIINNTCSPTSGIRLEGTPRSEVTLVKNSGLLFL